MPRPFSPHDRLPADVHATTRNRYFPYTRLSFYHGLTERRGGAAERENGGAMTQETNHRGSLSRRGFLRATGAAGVALAAAAGVTGLGSLAVADAGAGAPAEEDKVVCCLGNCSGGCILEATVRDGRVCSLKNCQLINDRGRENICQRGTSNVYRLYSDRRILYPLRRVGERGDNEFERISWDEAIAELSEKWKGYIAEFGPSSIGVFGGSGNQSADGTADFGVPHDGYVSRMIAYLNLDKMILDADSAGMAMYARMIGGSTSGWGNDWLDLPNADHILCWACNPTEAMVGRYHNVTEAQAGGTTLTVIDPIFTLTAAKADKFVPIRPGSDGLLAIACMQKILDEGLQDEEFLKHQSVGGFLVKDADGKYLRLSDLGRAQAGAEDDLPVALEADGMPVAAVQAVDPQLSFAGEVQGIAVHTAYDLIVERINSCEYGIAEICEMTDVPEEQIDYLVDLLTDGSTTLITSYGADHYVNGHTFYSCVLTLMMLTGNLGHPGAGILGPGVAHLLSAAGGDTSAMVTPEGEGLGFSHRIPGNSIKDVVATGKFGDADVTLKSIYVQCANLIGNQAERRLWIDEILPKIDYLVVAEQMANDTTKYADLVLPAAHWWECERYWTREGYTAMSEKVHDPLGEALPDLEICNLILEAMGKGDACIDREEFMTRSFEDEASRAAGISWEKIKQEKLVKTVPDGFVNVNPGTGTPEGRFSFYREDARPDPDVWGQQWDFDRERMLYWEPPREAWPTSEAAQSYPLQLISERGKFKVHTMFSDCPNLLEIDNEPSLTMNPADADERGIVTGDYVHVFNDRGDFTCKVNLNPGTRPGVMQMDHGWQDEQFVQGHYQDVTSNYSGNVFANNCYHDCMVQAEKA